MKSNNELRRTFVTIYQKHKYISSITSSTFFAFLIGLLICIPSGVIRASFANTTTSTATAEQLLSILSVEASSYYAPAARFPSNAIDGSMWTAWTTSGMPEWIILDLGKPSLVNKSRINIYSNNVAGDFRYTIAVSMDKINWVNVIVKGSIVLAPNWTENAFGPVSARYVRVSLSSAYSANYANLFEIELYGDDTQSIVNNTNTEITLTWKPNLDGVLGYKIFYGTMADTANTQVADIPVNSPSFIASAPSKVINSWNDLRLPAGSNVCFIIRAYNTEGLSPASAAACRAI